MMTSKFHLVTSGGSKEQYLETKHRAKAEVYVAKRKELRKKGFPIC